ncbi:MAG: addiction module antitoxin [Caulobacteraceae bacterium]
MDETMTLNVRVSGALGRYVRSNVGADGAYENLSEYVRDLVRKDMEKAECERFQRLKAELARAFATPDDAYVALCADEVIERNHHLSAGGRL